MSACIRRASLAVVLGVLAAACTGTAPEQPSASSATGATAPAAAAGGGVSSPLLTASVTTPRPLQPAAGALVPYASQPITLLVGNAVITQSGTVTYTFEVATDAAFTNKVASSSSVAQGASGQTSLVLAALAGGSDYYWHARATGGGTTGLFSPAVKFTIGPAITISAPVPIGPLTNAQTSVRPALLVANAARTGPAGAITYRFDIATTSAFSPIFMTGTNTEGVNQTGFVPPTDLPVNTLFFWRATAMDVANGVTSAPSATQSFTTTPSAASVIAAQLGVALWPGVQPSGSPGQAVLGSDWNVEPLVSFNGVTFLNPPIDEVRIFDLLDRGYQPQAAIDWMNGNGYATAAAYYPSVDVIGFQYEYLAYVNGAWNVVLKVGA